MPYKELTTKQQKFADNILSCKFSSARKAYEDVYACRGASADAAAARLLKNVKVAKYLDEQRQKASYNTEVTQERILKEESCLSFSKIGNIFELKNGTLIKPSELPEEVQRSISGLEIKEETIAGVKKTLYKYKFWDKGRSLERLEKHLGMFEKDNKQRKLTMEEIIAALPDDFRDGVCKAITGILSDRGN